MAGWCDDELLLQALDYEPQIRATLARYTNNPADVAELLQETYARLLNIPRDPIRSVRALALTVARNVALDWIRHRKVVPLALTGELEELDARDESPGIEDQINSDQELKIVVSALQTLPGRCRDVFILRKVYQCSYKEIAERLKISPETVHGYITKGAPLFARALLNSPQAKETSLPQRSGRNTRFGKKGDST